MKFLSIAAALLPIVSGLVLPRTLSEVSQSLALRAEDPCRIVSNVTVVSGDTLTKIANATGSTVDAIVFVNPNITNPDFIYVGEVINIPATECNDVAPSLSDTTAATATCATVGTASTYTVAAGDTLTIIAARFGITLDALVAANTQIEDIDVIDIGEVINVPVCTS